MNYAAKVGKSVNTYKEKTLKTKRGIPTCRDERSHVDRLSLFSRFPQYV